MTSPTNANALQRFLSIPEEGGLQSQDDEQVVWVYCQGEQEKSDVFTCCKSSQRPSRKAQVPKGEGWKTWQPMLQSSLPKVPAPYTMAEREVFWLDAGIMLEASLSGGHGGRWPPLLVTDRENLCQVAATGYIRSKLAEVAQTRESQLVTVVLAEDFGHLCGVLVAGAPLPRAEPLLPPEEPKEAMGSSKDVTLRCGVYVQRQNLVSIGQEPRGALFGARCLALFADLAAYCAVAPDGARSVEAAGRWEVINGQVVLFAEGSPTGSHLKLTKLNATLVPEISYEQPIFVPLEELESDFDSPISLAECIPRGGELLRLQLLEEGIATSLSLPAPHPVSEAQVLTNALDSTFATAWDVTSPTSPFSPTASPPEPDTPGPGAAQLDPRPAAPARPAERTYFLRTPIHALLSLANPSPEPVPDAKPSGPRLFGMQRGITTSLPAEMQWEPHTAKRQSDVLQMRRIPGRLLTDDSERTAQTCTLQPGTYSFESGQPKDYSYKKLDFKLHVDGKCEYKELAQGSSLRAKPREATWRVEAELLVMDSPKSSFSFILREFRGSKSMERKVGRLDIPLSTVHRCRFAPFPQHLEPFPSHQPLPSTARIFGVVDPDAPLLRALRCRPDRLPYHAFERELRRQGLPVDEILTDFRFVDRDADGLVSVDEMRRLETYGNPVAAPEVLDEFREALVKNFGSLSGAFEPLSAQCGAGRVTAAEFERFLNRLEEVPTAGRPLVAPGSKGQALRDWLQRHDAETRTAVFASLCPEGDAIDLPDFLSLNMHGAVLALRRLEHFQSWVIEGFGSTGEVFRKVFKTLGSTDGKGLSCKALWEGAQALGYPCELRVMKSVFSLLDRNFDGEVNAREFQKLLEFRCEDVLREVEALKRFADTMLGGLEAAFAKLLERERILQGLPASPKMAGYNAFNKVCMSAGFNKMAPKADLKMLFLFLNEVSGRQTAGLLSISEWSLLKGFNSKAISGSPARLRRILQEAYGGIDEAFQQMHTTWLRRALTKGLKQTAMAGLVHSVLNPTSPERSPSGRAYGAGVAGVGVSAGASALPALSGVLAPLKPSLTRTHRKRSVQ